MLGNIIAFVVGLIVGLLIAWYYWRGRFGEHETRINSLQTSLNQRERSVQELQARLQERDATLEKLRGQIEPDDLKRIEGIGPKISGVLADAGIMTFGQLADADVGRLQQVLTDAGMTLADPASWPEQARLAAAGDWTALEKLQDELQGGRRA
jgi:predicted flap endonuclease-1-like 5' DNA nuclease